MFNLHRNGFILDQSPRTFILSNLSQTVKIYDMIMLSLSIIFVLNKMRYEKSNFFLSISSIWNPETFSS